MVGKRSSQNTHCCIATEGKNTIPSSALPADSSLAGPVESPSHFGNLPFELIELICSFCESSVSSLLMNKCWYVMAARQAYAEPHLTASNFSLFARALSENHALAANVRALDLSTISRVGNSVLAVLLRHCAPRLEVFVAPKSRFAHSSMISLPACERLRHLDLGLVSETLDLADLLTTIQNFHDLEVLIFPPSSTKCDDNMVIEWPSNLRQLRISGGFPSRLLEQTVFPKSLTSLGISNCPHLTTYSLNKLLEKVGQQLTDLSLEYVPPHHEMRYRWWRLDFTPYIDKGAADCVLTQCPNLQIWQVNIECISFSALDYDLVPSNHPLRELQIRCCSEDIWDWFGRIDPPYVLVAIRKLTNLRRVSTPFNWDIRHGASELRSKLRERGGDLIIER